MPTPIDAIRPHPRNPRRIAQEALAKLCESIQRDPEFMRLRPIVVDAEGQILGGNQRWKACKALGFAELPDGWVVKADDLTDEQRRRFILVDNAPEGMAGGWDFDLLKTEWNLPELGDLGLLPPDVFQADEAVAPELAEGDRAPFRQATFTLHDEQWEEVEAAMKKAKSEGGGKSAVNENSNGNALAWICGKFNRG